MSSRARQASLISHAISYKIKQKKQQTRRKKGEINIQLCHINSSRLSKCTHLSLFALSFFHIVSFLNIYIYLYI